MSSGPEKLKLTQTSRAAHPRVTSFTHWACSSVLRELIEIINVSMACQRICGRFPWPLTVYRAGSLQTQRKISKQRDDPDMESRSLSS